MSLVPVVDSYQLVEPGHKSKQWVTAAAEAVFAAKNPKAASVYLVVQGFATAAAFVFGASSCSFDHCFCLAISPSSLLLLLILKHSSSSKHEEQFNALK